MASTDANVIGIFFKINFIYFQFSVSQFTRQICQTNQIKQTESWKSVDVVLGPNKGFVVTDQGANSPAMAVQRPLGYPGAPFNILAFVYANIHNKICKKRI